MRLIGMLDSPYVRRVAISMRFMGLRFNHEPVSVFRHYDRFKEINPTVKAPTLVNDDGVVLMESSLILDYLDQLVAPEQRLMPREPRAYAAAQRVVGLALVACEKTVQIVYERELRPAEKHHAPWLERVGNQLTAAYDLLNDEIAAETWEANGRLLQPAISAAVAWRFTAYVLPGRFASEQYPALAALSEKLEALPDFRATPLE